MHTHRVASCSTHANSSREHKKRNKTNAANTRKNDFRRRAHRQNSENLLCALKSETFQSASQSTPWKKIQSCSLISCHVELDCIEHEFACSGRCFARLEWVSRRIKCHVGVHPSIFRRISPQSHIVRERFNCAFNCVQAAFRVTKQLRRPLEPM